MHKLLPKSVEWVHCWLPVLLKNLELGSYAWIYEIRSHTNGFAFKNVPGQEYIIALETKHSNIKLTEKEQTLNIQGHHHLPSISRQMELAIQHSKSRKFHKEINKYLQQWSIRHDNIKVLPRSWSRQKSKRGLTIKPRAS